MLQYHKAQAVLEIVTQLKKKLHQLQSDQYFLGYYCYRLTRGDGQKERKKERKEERKKAVDSLCRRAS